MAPRPRRPRRLPASDQYWRVLRRTFAQGVWMPPQRDSTTSCERIRAKPADALLTLAGVAFRQRDYALAIERLTRLA